MQKILKQSHYLGSYAISHVASSAAFAGVLAILFLFAGVSVASADTTYVVDATSPNGTCGTVCQQLQAYLNGAGTNVYGYTGGNGSNNGYGSGNPYFSQVGGNGNGNYGTGNGSNVYNPNSTYGANGSNYSPAPYMVYNYYNNPNLSGVPNTYSPYGTNAAYGAQNYGTPNYGAYNPYGNTSAYASPYGSAYSPYSNRMYVQYPQSGSSTANTTSASANKGKGFTLTSGY